MSEMVKFGPQTYGELVSYVGQIVQSPACPVKNAADALLIVMTGAELGIPPMQSLRGLHVIKGRAVLSADAIAGVVRKSGLCASLALVELTNERCVYKTTRRDDPAEQVYTFSLDDARQAGLLGNDNYKKHPRAMLRARCIAAICRAVYPDALMGVYVEGELIDEQQVESQIHRSPQAAAPREEFEDAQLVEDSEAASNSPEDLGGSEAAPKDWSEDEQWKRAQRFYRMLISEGDVLDRDELEQVHIYTRRIMGVTSSRHIDPARFKKLNSQIAAVPVEDRAEWLRGKIAEMHPNPIETQLDKPAAHTAA
jgi:hypothetical protein